MNTTNETHVVTTRSVGNGNITQGTRMQDAQAIVSAMLGPLLGNLLKLEQKWKQQQTELLGTMGKCEANAARSMKEKGALESAVGLGTAMAFGGAALGAATSAGQAAKESGSYISDLKGFGEEASALDARETIAESPESYAQSVEKGEMDKVSLTEEDKENAQSENHSLTKEQACEKKLAEKKADKAKELYERHAGDVEKEKTSIKQDRTELDHRQKTRRAKHEDVIKSADVLSKYSDLTTSVSNPVMNMVYKPLESEQDAITANQKATAQVVQSGSSSADSTHGQAVQLAQEAARTAGESSASTARAAG